MAVIISVVRISWIFSIFLLAACGQVSGEVTQTQVVAATEASPTMMAEVQTEDISLTSSPEPNVIEVPVEMPIPTPLATETPGIRVVAESLSPDRRWEASVERIFRDGEQRVIFRVVLDYNDIEWIVEDIPYAELPPFGFPFPEPFYWTKDGQYLYYTHLRSGDGCFAGGRNRGFDFYQLDLFSGEIQQIANGGSWISISPDEKYLATIDDGLELWSLEKEDVETFEPLVSREEAGMEIDQKYIVWAPDSRSLVYVIAAGVCDLDRGYFNWVVRVDVDTLTQVILLARDERALVPVAWIEPDKIIVSDGTRMYWMDTTTREVFPFD